MSSFLLTRATVEELKDLLVRAGKEILAEGGAAELAAFIASGRGRTMDDMAVIWLAGTRRELQEAYESMLEPIGPG
jgi:hypothetical protein